MGEVWPLEGRDEDLGTVVGCRVLGLGFRVKSVGVWGFGVLGFRVLGFSIQSFGV